MPDLSLEIVVGRIVSGIDEVGRGCVAGPVVAAAVIIPDPGLLVGPLVGIDDSKRLSASRRESLRAAILRHCPVGIGSATPEEIDAVNILQATFLAMRRALASLGEQSVDHVLVDGNRVPPGLEVPATAIVKGDSRSASIAAASIVAKTERDRLMRALDAEFPGYGWARNVGYPTGEHLEAIARRGVTVHHRRTFAGVRGVSEAIGAT